MIFHTDACPIGLSEVESLKGYMLMGRPKNGTTGTVINSPLSKDEKARVGYAWGRTRRVRLAGGRSVVDLWSAGVRLVGTVAGPRSAVIGGPCLTK